MLHIRRVLTIAAIAVLLATAVADAQAYDPPKPRRHWVTVYYSWLYNRPLHFGDHPLSDFAGQRVHEAQRGDPYDYVSQDSSTTFDLIELTRGAQGAGITVYPIGLKTGPTLGIRGSIEGLPDIRVNISGPGPLDEYTLTNARAYDLGAGVFVADLSPGWGLGSFAFVVGGFGRVKSDQADGRRYFAEGGGGVMSGPIGVELSIKFGWNRFDDPVEHQFFAVPINVRATLTF